jgi:exosome complex component MTR3
LNCSIRYAPFAKNLQTTMMISSSTLDGYINTNTHIPSSSSSGLSSEEIQLSSALYDAIIPSIPTHILQKSVIDVFCMVLSSDGPVLAPCIIASSLALVDCGVEVYDLVSACTVAIVSKSTTNSNDCDQDHSDGHNHNDNPLNNTDDTVLLLDPTEQETFQANGIITLAMMGSWKDVTCWNQTGKILPEVSMDAAELCRDGCGLMNKFMRQCLVGSLSL